MAPSSVLPQSDIKISRYSKHTSFLSILIKTPKKQMKYISSMKLLKTKEREREKKEYSHSLILTHETEYTHTYLFEFLRIYLFRRLNSLKNAKTFYAKTNDNIEVMHLKISSVSF